MMRELQVSLRDPLIARDGRPFGIGQGFRMHSLSWPYPSTFAGAVRTILGKAAGGDFSADVVTALKQVTIHGPIASVGEELYFVIPKDAVLRAGDQKILASRPISLRLDEGCNLPDSKLLPVCLPSSVEDDFKPAILPAFWSASKVVEWLLSPVGDGFSLPSTEESIDSPKVDDRTHVKIFHEMGAAENRMLFQTAGLALPDRVKLSLRVDACDRFDEILNRHLPMLHPMSGERRLVRWESVSSSAWQCPRRIRESLTDAKYIRMVLATPALFQHGWLPDWIVRGVFPGTNIRVKLRAAILDRWKPISGWSIETANPGAKPIRRLVPAGSVYFLEKEDTTPLPIESLWLRSVSDADQDQRDGFGIALWGIWQNNLKEHD
jgi:CRISPR-associated protein Cmr3